MTTILCWLSVDSRGPSSIYIVEDSRITWGSISARWDSGRKVFACRTADIFGYCGDVLYPSLLLGQLGDLIDRGALWDQHADAAARHATIFEYLKASLENRHHAPEHGFTIIHGARDGDRLASSFYAWKISYDASRQDWSDDSIPVGAPKKSTVLLKLGSGHQALDREIEAWNASPQGGTARSLFTAFCDSLENEGDPLSGGVPQIVSLDRRGGGKLIGYIVNETRYLYGLPIQPLPELTNLDWVDPLFQRLSPDTLKLLPNAQRHARVSRETTPGFAAFIKKFIN